MNALFDIINVPLGWVLRFISGLFGNNFAAAIFVFTLLVNIAFIPLTIKGQKSAVQQLRIKPKLDELKKKYGNDRKKYSMAMSQLYQQEGVSMSGGCLPMILRLVFMMCIYWLIMSPITYLMQVDASAISEAQKALGSNGNELQLLQAIKNGKVVAPEILEASKNISFSFFGIDLIKTPDFDLDIFSKFQSLWIMPLLSFASQIISSMFTMKIQKKNNPDAPSMSGMLILMPLISLFIGFSLPCGVTFYWACSSLIGGVMQILVQEYYGPQKMLAKLRVKELASQCDFETGQIKKLGQ